MYLCKGEMNIRLSTKLSTLTDKSDQILYQDILRPSLLSRWSHSSSGKFMFIFCLLLLLLLLLLFVGRSATVYSVPSYSPISRSYKESYSEFLTFPLNRGKMKFSQELKSEIIEKKFSISFIILQVTAFKIKKIRKKMLMINYISICICMARFLVHRIRIISLR